MWALFDWGWDSWSGGFKLELNWKNNEELALGASRTPSSFFFFLKGGQSRTHIKPLHVLMLPEKFSKAGGRHNRMDHTRHMYSLYNHCITDRLWHVVTQRNKETNKQQTNKGLKKKRLASECLNGSLDLPWSAQARAVLDFSLSSKYSRLLMGERSTIDTHR